MSYVFTSPKYNVRQCPTDDDSLGGLTQGHGLEQWLATPLSNSIGPDQRWTEANKGKEIVPATKDCHRGWQSGWNYIYGKPPSSIGHSKLKKNCSNPAPRGCRPGLAVRDYRFEDCFKTGRIDEAYKPGFKRHEWWCCPPIPAMKPERTATANELDLYGEDVCQSFYREGEVYVGKPKWLDNNFLIPTGWDLRETDIIDGGYRLFCQAIMPKDYFTTGPGGRLASGGMQTVTIHAIDAAEELARKEERAAEEEEVIQAAESEFEYSFFERYGLYMLVGGGVIGVALIAGLVKRSVS